MPYGGSGLPREASTATRGLGRFSPHRRERPVCGFGPLLPARFIPRASLPSHSAMASPCFFVVSPNRSGRAGVRRSTSALSHHRADGGDVGGFGLGRARGGPLDSRSTSSGGQRLQAQYVGRRGGAGHGLVRRRDGNRGTAISLGPRPKLHGFCPGVPEGERYRAPARDTGACHWHLAADGAPRRGSPRIGWDASALGRATRRGRTNFTVRSSPELCVKVRGSSSMLRLGCLGDLLGLEE